MTQGACRVAARMQRLHEPDGKTPVAGVDRLQSLPPRHGADKVATCHPGLEPGGAFHVDPVEKRPLVQRHRGGMVGVEDRLTEACRVHVNKVAVEPQRRLPENGIGIAELPAEGVEQLLQRTTGAFLAAVRPEQRHHAFPRQTRRSGRSERRQQRQCLALIPDKRLCRPHLLERKSSQRLQAMLPNRHSDR